MLRSVNHFTVILSFLVCLVGSIKIAIFVPDMSGSQVIWNARVANELSKAGHDVTLIRLKFFDMEDVKPELLRGIKQWNVEIFGYSYKELERKQSALLFREISVFDAKSREVMNIMTDSLIKSCQLAVENKPFMDRLKSEKFELAFAHMYELCSIGLIRAANISTWIWLNSGQLQDYVADYMGVPSPPSYVPPLIIAATDQMTFLQRIKSLIGHIAGPLFYEKFVITQETAIFRNSVDPNFPYLDEIAKSCPLVMVNSNELYNLPRPTLHKIVYIGGLGMSSVHAKPLTGEFKVIADRAKYIAVMTFGSFVNESAMPDLWKKALINSFSKFPDVEFIIRYSSNDLDGNAPKNVHPRKWIPQVDLLHHNKTRLLITHCGYNSLQEAIYSSTPMITIPLFGDQPGNAKLAEKHGFGYNLMKSEISEETVTKALRTVLEDERYIENVRRLHAMIIKKPTQPEQLLVKWTEFLAEFKTLDNLVPYGTKLSFIQYHCLDVIATFIILFFVTIFLIYRTILYIICAVRKKIFGGEKEKHKKE